MTVTRCFLLAVFVFLSLVLISLLTDGNRKPPVQTRRCFASCKRGPIIAPCLVQCHTYGPVM